MRWVILALLLSGCVYTPEKKVATEYILRPNGNGALTEWGGTFADINEDVGVLGDITSIDTARLALWGVTTTPWLEMETGGLNGQSSGPPDDVVHKTQEVLWEDYSGGASDRVTSLKFRWAAWAVSLGGNGGAKLDIYIDGDLVSTIDITVTTVVISIEPWTISVRETEVVLPHLVRGTDINTLQTNLRSTSTAAETWLYALECRAVTSEKDTEKDINPSDGGEKVIPIYPSQEKP